MRRLRMGICFLLVLVMLVCDCGMQVYAEALPGTSEDSAIVLKSGKAKSAKLQDGWISTYFSIELKEASKLAVSLQGEKIGTDVSVTICRRIVDYVTWSQTATFKYSKSKKKVSGSMTSEYILPKGIYIIKVISEERLDAAKKIKITTKITSAGLQDVEPNFPEENAQPMDVAGAKSYKMLLSSVGELNEIDATDCFTFKLKKNKKFRLKVTLKAAVSGVEVSVCKKDGDKYITVQDYALEGKKLDKTFQLHKGTYFVKIRYSGDEMLQIPYTISGSVK